MPMVMMSKVLEPVAISVVTIARSSFSGKTTQLSEMPGLASSNTSVKLSMTIMSGLFTVAMVSSTLSCADAAKTPKSKDSTTSRRVNLFIAIASLAIL